MATQSQPKSSEPAKSIDLLKPELPSSDSTLAQPTSKADPSKALTDSSSSQNSSNVDANGASSDNATAQDASTNATATPSLSSATTRRILNGQVSKAGLKDSENGTDGNAVLIVPDARAVPMTINLNIDDLRAIDNPKLQRSLDRLQAIFGPRVMQNIQMSQSINLGARRVTMSTEQFRKLEYGVIGMDSFVALGAANPVVRECYRTCPAATAGIMPGDVLVKADDYAFKQGDGQRVLWQKVTGKAETPVDITVLRQGQLITFHLKRMNIEDIQDDGIRHTFEVLLSRLGPQQEQP
jgi:hypothetical protein